MLKLVHSLAKSICHRECIWKLAIMLDSCILELPRHWYELGRTAKLCHNVPKSLTTDCAKCFGKVNKGLVEVPILFLALLLKLSCCEDHANCSAAILHLHCLSGRSPDCSRCSFNRFSRTPARIFPATDNKEIPRWLSQTWGFPFCLTRWIIVAYLNSKGMISFLRIMWNKSVSFSATGEIPAL